MKIAKNIFIIILILVLVPILFSVYLYNSADMGVPDMTLNVADQKAVKEDGYLSYQKSALRQSESGLWELRLSGTPQERGTAFGVLAKDLLYYQESVFVNQIRTIIPSDSYLRFLRFFTVIFNRNLGKYVPEEYRQEIYAMSQFCTAEFDAIGTPYERQLNYHAAHDIGHTMQEYMLVGCSSFGVWNESSADSTLLIGRNFDFYVGDDFAKNKLIMIVNPDSGYRFVSVGWAGMTGVLSGMNDQGLTVTLNAAKGDLPTSAALPISLLAREILQYASTIEEAYKIAEGRSTFVSESLLIGSAKDGKAAIIEKTPRRIALFETQGSSLICTNHYQAEKFANDPQNIANIENSDSPYRFARMKELLSQYQPVSVDEGASILRNRFGMKNQDIGIANEKTINQSIAHHSVLFKPAKKQMWVSTAPWQSGEYVCYDLNDIFDKDFSNELQTRKAHLPADSVFLKNDYPKLQTYRSGINTLKKAISNPDSAFRISDSFVAMFVSSNPNHYYVYNLLGDFYKKYGNNKQADENWRKALTCEIPYQSQKKEIQKKLNE